jgi:hypothetical protein
MLTAADELMIKTSNYQKIRKLRKEMSH